MAPILDECCYLDTASSTTSTVKSPIPWDDRIALQARWTSLQKGWQQTATVEWRPSPLGGIGLFNASSHQPIPAYTVLRIGLNGRNLQQFTCAEDIEHFCRRGSNTTNNTMVTEEEYKARLRYVTDYLWGYSEIADECGYELPHQPFRDDRFFGMWIPGNGLNHSEQPNMVYRTLCGGTEVGIAMVTLCEIAPKEELFDDYRRHGTAPPWLLQFAQDKQVTLNFAGCNDFVGKT
jgi:hypothetical protein